MAVTSVDPSIIVEADRQILAGALANLVQNALNFTRSGTTVSLRANTTSDRVLIEVEDECGGLPPGKVENLLRPFVQQGSVRTGLGLGLSICLKAVNATAGELHIRDVPGKGASSRRIFRSRPPPTSISARQTSHQGAQRAASGGGKTVRRVS